MTKDYWMASQLSIARYSGGCKINGKEYLVVPQSYDLVRTDFIKYYTKLERDKFMEVVKLYPHAEDKDLKQHMENVLNEKKAKSDVKQAELF